MSTIRDLSGAGQSVWLDFIRRDMLGSDGELADLVTDGLGGVTSNPSIFQKAISSSAAYDGQIQSFLRSRPDASVAEVFEELAIRDIKGAADVLRPVYDATGGADGFVSLEVSPHLAYDAEGTISEAHRLWERVGRPNLMIKVPATAEGIPAVERLLGDGLNINITLMFSLDHYETVAHTFLRGLGAAADPGSIASVASFFVSRVDTMVDAALEKVGTEAALALRGRIAVANAKLTYRRYQEIFEGDEFAELAARGARPQRVLWASTSTKNPAYSDTLYVDELVGPNTVNTMPPQTIEAFRDHGVVDPAALTTDVDAAEAQIRALGDLGIDLDDITETLQTEGVQAFADSADELLEALEAKMGELRG